MTQVELGEAAGVHPISIARLESGARQSGDADTLMRLARGLGVRVSELLEEEPPAPIAAALDAFVASAWAQAASPTAEEMDWLRSLPSSFWRGFPAEPKALFVLLEARRLGRP